MFDTPQKILIFALTFISFCFLVWVVVNLFLKFFEKYEKQYVAATSESLREMFIFQDPKKVFMLNVVSTILFLFVGLLISRNPIYIAIFGVIGFLIPKLFLWWTRKKRLEAFAKQMVDGLMVLCNALRSGMNLVQAIEVLESEQGPPISQEFGLVVREYTLGVPLEEALKNLAKRVPNDDLQLLVASVNIVLGMGGNLTEIFESMANVIRERSQLEGKTKALTAQGKLQGLVVGLLPTALGGVMYVMDPPTMMLMFTTLIGNVSLGVMVTLQVVGYFMIRKITNIEV